MYDDVAVVAVVAAAAAAEHGDTTRAANVQRVSLVVKRIIGLVSTRFFLG